MKIKLLLFALLIAPFFASAQLTYVPDDNFENYLETHNASGGLVIPGSPTSMGNGIINDDYVITANINTLTVLTISDREIFDLTGIQDFASLITLYCGDNPLENVDLSNNIALEVLDFYDNNLVSLDLSNNTSITQINVYRNQLTSLDLSNNTALEVLGCSRNQISSLDLSNNTAMSILFCDRNQLTSLNVKNGNNTNYNPIRFHTWGNPDLLCIEVDDPIYSEEEWNNEEFAIIDSHTIFSEDCSPCDETNTPVINIAQSELPAFCQGASVVLTANTQISETEWITESYLWSTGETTPSIEISQNGTYSVTVTNDVCETIEDITITDFEAENLLSTYTILASEEVKLEDNNTVLSGAVGATESDGKVKVLDMSAVSEFVKAFEIELDNVNAVSAQISGSVTVNIPDFVFNDTTTGDSPDIVVDEDEFMLLTGSDYGKIELKDNAAVTFSNNENVYVKELKVGKDASISLDGCANLYVKKKVKFNERSVFNPEGNMVVFYVDDLIEVMQGAVINANMYSTDEIKVEGDEDEITYMKGLFIGKKVKGKKFVVWESNTTCLVCDGDNSDDGDIIILNRTASTKPVNKVETFEFKTWPIPSISNFNIKLVSANSVDNVVIKVYNLNGSLVHENIFESNSKYQFGNDLSAGIYIVKLKQADTTKTIRVVKY